MKERLHRADPKQKEEILKQVAVELLSERDVLFAYFYGSFVELDVFHDIDLGVYLRDSDRKTAAILFDLVDRLSSSLELCVDVRLLNEAPVSFLYHVFRGRLVMSRDDDLHTRIMERTIQRYLDIAPLLRRSTREAFAA